MKAERKGQFLDEIIWIISTQWASVCQTPKVSNKPGSWHTDPWCCKELERTEELTE